jgi:hypothetical protein
MKLIFAVILILVLQQVLYPQIKEIDKYCDSIDVMVSGENSYGIYYTQTINLERNVCAIGLQKTNVTICYGQPEDSVYDDGKKVEFIPRYIPPFKIKTGYNIAASQDVSTEFFLDAKGQLVMYRFITKGFFTCGIERFYFQKNKLIRIEKQAIDSCASLEGIVVDKNTSYFEKYDVYKRDKNFTREDKEDAEDILDNLKEYLELYYNLFEIERLDKE